MNQNSESTVKGNNTQKGGSVGIISVLLIQLAVVVFTFSSICSKMAGANAGSITVSGITIHGLSFKGWLWMFAEVLCLGVYAVFWQQIIKKFDLSIAYANRAFAIFWTFLWSILFFHESVRPANVIGILLVFCGIMLVNSETSKGDER